MILLELGFRRVLSSGVLIRATPLRSSPADHPKPPAAATADVDLKLVEVQAIHDRLAAGWCPGLDELMGAPVIDEWEIVVRPDGIALIGRILGHPRLRDGHVAITSLVTAFDGSLAVWARTMSRFYQLGRPSGRALSS